MGLEKAIRSGKERRKPYRKAKLVDRTCRNHGTCSWCHSNRVFKSVVRKQIVEEKLREYKRGLVSD